MEDEKNQSPHCQLYFLCCLEPSVYSSFMAFHSRGFFRRQGAVYPGK